MRNSPANTLVSAGLPVYKKSLLKLSERVYASKTAAHSDEVTAGGAITAELFIGGVPG